MEAGNFKDALSLLDKSLKMNKQIMGENDQSNSQILMVIGQVCLRQKDFDRALETMHTAIEVIEQSGGGESEQLGSCYLELSQAYIKLNMVSEALEHQSRAF